ncbi:MAG: hypothetical protein LBG88_00700 [Christensenellaceae bacterium]|jgi:hypothetical protein|nr:hypothetical protein [Christensenellaceae bacterium]
MKNTKLLLIDTSADYCHSDKIATVFTPEQIRGCDGFEIVNTNTKSWTASRVGVTAIKALAFGTGKPVYENGKQIDIHTLEPYYNAEFIVNKSNTPQ